RDLVAREGGAGAAKRVGLGLSSYPPKINFKTCAVTRLPPAPVRARGKAGLFWAAGAFRSPAGPFRRNGRGQERAFFRLKIWPLAKLSLRARPATIPGPTPLVPRSPHTMRLGAPGGRCCWRPPS